MENADVVPYKAPITNTTERRHRTGCIGRHVRHRHLEGCACGRSRDPALLQPAEGNTDLPDMDEVRPAAAAEHVQVGKARLQARVLLGQFVRVALVEVVEAAQDTVVVDRTRWP